VSQAPAGWKPIHLAPVETDISVCVEDGFGVYPLPFPCRKCASGWINAKQGTVLHIVPLGWRQWAARFRRKTW
jgi:hypothetical protein